MTQSMKLKSSLSLVFLAALLMGNQKCEQAPQRKLKKNIQIISLEASDFLDQSGFNFSEVAQSQFSGVIFDSEDFYERSLFPRPDGALIPLPGPGSAKISALQKAESQQSMAQLKVWFPEMKQLETRELNSESSCLVSRPQHYIAGKINALEAFGGGKLQFGFAPTAGVQLPISANFSLDQMRMDLSFQAIDPWTGQKVTSVNSAVKKTDYKVGFGINLGIINIGPEFYRVTGMAETTLKGLKKGLDDLKNKIKGVARQEWQSRVLISRDNYVVIVGGAELGLQKGDKLKIVNEIHDWTGVPCGPNSILNGSLAVSSIEPWIVEIEDAGNLLSLARVTNPREDVSINVGARATVSELYVEPKAKPKEK